MLLRLTMLVVVVLLVGLVAVAITRRNPRTLNPELLGNGPSTQRAWFT